MRGSWIPVVAAGLAAAGSGGCLMPCGTSADCLSGFECQDEHCVLAGTGGGSSSSSSSSGGTQSSSSGEASSSSSGEASSSSSSGDVSSSSGAASSSSGAASSSSGAASSSSGAACPAPVLLVGVESRNGATTRDGQVRRFALGSGGEVTECSALTGSPRVENGVQAVLAPNTSLVLVATPSVITAIRTSNNTTAWTLPMTGWVNYPADLFMVNLDGSWRPAVANRLDFSDTWVGEIAVINLDTHALGEAWRLRSFSDGQPVSISRSSIISVTGHPSQPGHVVLADEFDEAALDVTLPRGATPVAIATLKADVGTGGVRSVASARGPGNVNRFAWAATANPGEAYLGIQPDGTAEPTVFGPLTCPGAPCNGARFLHAVPDPTAEGRVFAICQPRADWQHHVVRLDKDTGDCTAVLTGSNDNPPAYPNRLGVMLPE